jgi:tetratricopeptide (TPR) repeat protein
MQVLYHDKEKLMNTTSSCLIAILLLVLMNGCAFVGVPATSDPAKKLADAYDLMDRGGRPIPAEQLIREAIDIYMKEGNEVGLGWAYKTYGSFFCSTAVKKASGWYIKNGFQDTSASYEARFEKAVEYYKKAEDIFIRHKAFGKLTNMYLNMGYAYDGLGDNKKTCEAFRKSLDSNKQYLAADPSAPVILPKGYKTYEEYVSENLKAWKCN